MAFTKSFVDQCGNSYDSSYWRLVQANFGIADSSGYCTFCGYKDEDAYLAGSQALPGATKAYTIKADEFTALMASPSAGGTVAEELDAAIESYAMAKLEDDGSPSFFADSRQAETVFTARAIK